MSARTIRYLAAPVLALVASVAFSADRTFDQHFDAPAGGRLTVRGTDHGSIVLVGFNSRDLTFSVAGHDSRDVTVHAEIGGTSASKFEISATQDASGVTVTARTTDRVHVGISTLHAKVNIEVPRDYPVELDTSDGDVDIRGVNASVKGSTSDGRVVLTNIKGDMSLRSSDGSIEVTDATGGLSAHTSDGHIYLDNVDGKIDASTSDGNIEARVRSNQGISLKTSDGSLTLRLPSDVHGSLDAKTSDGRVHCDIPVTTTEAGEKSHIHGTLNGGGELINLHTSDGSIHIEAL